MELSIVLSRTAFALVMLALLATVIIPAIFFFIKYGEFRNDYDEGDSEDKEFAKNLKDEYDKVFGVVIVIIVLIPALYLYIYFVQKKIDNTLYMVIFYVLVISIIAMFILILVFGDNLSNEASKIIRSLAGDPEQGNYAALVSETPIFIGLIAAATILLSLFAIILYFMLEKNPYVKSPSKKRLIRKTLFK